MSKKKKKKKEEEERRRKKKKDKKKKMMMMKKKSKLESASRTVKGLRWCVDRNVDRDAVLGVRCEVLCVRCGV